MILKQYLHYYVYYVCLHITVFFDIRLIFVDYNQIGILNHHCVDISLPMFFLLCILLGADNSNQQMMVLDYLVVAVVFLGIVLLIGYFLQRCFITKQHHSRGGHSSGGGGGRPSFEGTDHLAAARTLDSMSSSAGATADGIGIGGAHVDYNVDYYRNNSNTSSSSHYDAVREDNNKPYLFR